MMIKDHRRRPPIKTSSLRAKVVFIVQLSGKNNLFNGVAER